MATKIITVTASTTTTRHSWFGDVFRMILLCLPGLILGILGWVHWKDGVAVDAAIPVPVYMVAQIKMPKAAYVEAAKALNNVDPRNGNGLLASAEAHMRAGAPVSKILSLLRDGLEHEPASARGWTLLAENLYRLDKGESAKALSEAFVLAPRDYWLAGARAQDAELLWSSLDTDTQAMALAQTRLLWQEPQLHEQLRAVVRTSPALIARTFSGDDIRAINRWMVLEQGARQ